MVNRPPSPVAKHGENVSTAITDGQSFRHFTWRQHAYVNYTIAVRAPCQRRSFSALEVSMP